MYPLTHDSLIQQLQFGKNQKEIVNDSENIFICKDSV